ncbi:transposase [Kitasatospora sp. NBC_00315]|uniref:transposase n=1 Tax=Kitasatospora sp. NBC_00315 TaxID=2975963 RepID=UPI00352E2941
MPPVGGGPGSGRAARAPDPTRPDHVLGDKGHNSRAFRSYPRRRGIPHTIPEQVDQAGVRRRRGPRGGRPPGFDKQKYTRRHTVERCFHRLKQCRGIATDRPGRGASRGRRDVRRRRPTSTRRRWC